MNREVLLKKKWPTIIANLFNGSTNCRRVREHRSCNTNIEILLYRASTRWGAIHLCNNLVLLLATMEDCLIPFSHLPTLECTAFTDNLNITLKAMQTCQAVNLNKLTSTMRCYKRLSRRINWKSGTITSEISISWWQERSRYLLEEDTTRIGSLWTDTKEKAWTDRKEGQHTSRHHNWDRSMLKLMLKGILRFRGSHQAMLLGTRISSIFQWVNTDKGALTTVTISNRTTCHSSIISTTIKGTYPEVISKSIVHIGLSVVKIEEDCHQEIHAKHNTSSNINFTTKSQMEQEIEIISTCTKRCRANHRLQVYLYQTGIKLLQEAQQTTVQPADIKITSNNLKSVLSGGVENEMFKKI